MVSDVKQSGTCWFRVLTAPGPGAVAVIEVVISDRSMAQVVLRRIMATSETHPFRRQESDGSATDAGTTKIWSLLERQNITGKFSATEDAIALNRICATCQDDGVSKGGELDATDVHQMSAEQQTQDDSKIYDV